MPKENPRGF